MKYLITVGVFLFFFIRIGPTYAATPSIFVSPQFANFNPSQTLKVDIKIDSAGIAFNAAQGKVTLTNLEVTNLIFGDCNFMFVVTPSIQNPSFAGGIPGSSATACTVYTMYIRPTAMGYGVVDITNGKIISYDTTQQILQSTQNTGYVFIPNSQPSVISPTSTPVPTQVIRQGGTQIGLGNNQVGSPGTYRANITVYDPHDRPTVGAQVTARPVGDTYQSQTPLTASTDASGKASFNDLQPGVYDVTAKKDGETVASSVFNIAGQNHDISLGLKTQNKPLSLTIVLSSVIGILVIIVITLFVYIYRNKPRNYPIDTSTPLINN